MGPPIKHTYYFMEPVMEWEPVFAWWPTRTWDRRWVWLRPVWRRLLLPKYDLPRCPGDPVWEYCRGATTNREE